MTSGFLWSMRVDEENRAYQIHSLPDSIPDLVRRLLVHRGHSNLDDMDAFLHPRLSELSDPFLLGEMELAVSRIFLALDQDEHVCIYGDYDVDGVTSVALLRSILCAYGLDVSHFIPIRSHEGYGLSEAGIARCLNECGAHPGLIITVDCGTSSVREVDLLNEQGIDVIIIDHHEMSIQGRPSAIAVVNPKVEDNSPYTYFCSAGVVFKLAHALLKQRRLEDFDLKEYLDMVAVATVADIVPLIDENRLLVRHGLARLSSSTNIGLRMLSEVAGLTSSMTAMNVGFRIGPRINAAGRMDSPITALELLLSTSINQARELAKLLDDYNRQRQEEEESIRKEAISMLHEIFDRDRDHVIVLGSRTWHPGVVGIVASQLMRRYHKPTFVIAFDSSGVGKGSGRSIPGVSLVQAIQHCSDYIVSGGGHEMAAGLVIREDQIEEFRKEFDAYVSDTTTHEQRIPTLFIDEEVSFEELTLELLDSYELLEPFGNSNPLPVFMTKGVFPSEPPKKVGTNHLKLFLRQGRVERDAIMFNGVGHDLPEPPWDVAFTIDRNVFRGRTSLSISIQDIRHSS